MNIYFIYHWYQKLFGKDYFYLYAMTVYHIEILFFVSLLGIEFNNLHTFLPLISPSHANNFWFINYEFDIFNFYTWFFTIIILLIDLTFLFIVKKEIKNHEEKNNIILPFKITNKKIFIIEALVFYLSIGNPFMRATLYFLSFNTIQIYVIYRIFFNIPFFKSFLKPCFILGAYISIIQLFFYPLIEFIKAYMLIKSMSNV